MSDIQLVIAFRLEKEAGNQVCGHRHNYYELVYYSQGSGSTHIGGENHGFSAGTYALIASETEHDETHQVAGEVFCLGFRTERKLPTLFSRDPEGNVFRIVKTVCSESTRQQHGYQDMIRAKLLELLVVLDRAERDNAPAPKNFEYVVNYLSENYYEKIVFSELASHLNLSYDYFQHRFRQLMGASPQQFLLRKRLEAAGELLKNSTASCTEIAYRCGFSTSSQFSMLFKRELGITPYQYRHTS